MINQRLIIRWKLRQSSMSRELSECRYTWFIITVDIWSQKLLFRLCRQSSRSVWWLSPTRWPLNPFTSTFLGFVEKFYDFNSFTETWYLLLTYTIFICMFSDSQRHSNSNCIHSTLELQYTRNRFYAYFLTGLKITSMVLNTFWNILLLPL